MCKERGEPAPTDQWASFREKRTAGKRGPKKMGSCVSSNYRDSSGFKDKTNGPSRVLGSKVNGYKNLSHQEEKSNNLSIGAALSSPIASVLSSSSVTAATAAAAASSAKFNNSCNSINGNAGGGGTRSAVPSAGSGITSSTPSHHSSGGLPTSSASDRALHHSASSTTNSSNNQTIVIALYTYHAKDEGDLSFKKGERLLVLDDRDPDWWLAKSLSKNERGYIPRNYVVSEQLETEEYVIHHRVSLHSHHSVSCLLILSH